jgi:hypothetical protein
MEEESEEENIIKERNKWEGKRNESERKRKRWDGDKVNN